MMNSILPILATLFITISVGDGLRCFECSSVNDNYCPEAMTSDDDNIVPYEDCSKIHEAQYCVKTTGVTGERSCMVGSSELSCFICDETKSKGQDGLSCHDPNFLDTPKSCKGVFDAAYCVKTEGVWAGSLGTRRFCSSRDMGNYCDYIKRPGDQLEYRSCVYTCQGNGCNGTPTLKPLTISLNIIIATSISILISIYTERS